MFGNKESKPTKTTTVSMFWTYRAGSLQVGHTQMIAPLQLQNYLIFCVLLFLTLGTDIWYLLQATCAEMVMHCESKTLKCLTLVHEKSSYRHVPFSTKQFEIKNTSFKYFFETVPFSTMNISFPLEPNQHALREHTEVSAEI